MRPRVLLSYSEAGTVTLEFALVLPAIVLVLAAGVSALGVAAQAIRLADAAGVVARAEARGEPGAGGDAAARLAPGATMSIERGDFVCVRLDRSVALGPIAGAVPLSSRSCAPSGGR